MACRWVPYGAVGYRWRDERGEGSPFGCATDELEFDNPHPSGWEPRNGRSRNFENGQLVWS